MTPHAAPDTPPRVLLGVSGGIAAFKAAELVRLLRTRGFEVRCAMTPAAGAFVTPLTLEVLSAHRVYTEDYLAGDGSGREQHVDAAQWADVLCVAPATANTLAKLALGLGDDFLSTAALVFEGPVVLAPAMHSAMWSKAGVERNLELLAERGATIVGPGHGPLASGEVGVGRMAEPSEIAAAVAALVGGGALAGRRVLVTAGPTHEAIDPVRFLSNRSSGRMGFALAAAAAAEGADTTLVSGPVELPTPPGVERVDVVSAAEMADAVRSRAAAAELVIMAAAVADFRPREPRGSKIKKDSAWSTLALERTEDILGGLRELAPRALLVGFAAETEEVEAGALAKLEAKGVDLLVANDVSRSDIGFASDDNEVTVYRRRGEPLHFERQPKRRLAAALIGLCAEALERSEGREREAG